MALRVTVAGGVGIEADGEPVPLAGLGRAGRLALAYLACERHRPVRRDELAEVLWGEELPRSWEQMLRGLTSRLRIALGEAGLNGGDVLTASLGVYELHLPPGTVVDVERAAADLATAEDALAAGDSERGLELATAVAAVAARPFLPEATGAWAERRQGELRELHLRALELQARAGVARRRWAAAVAAAEDAIAIEPFRESAHLALPTALAGAGNRGEALRAYERCRRMLADELGVNPSAAMESAYLDLLREEPPATPSPSSVLALALPPALAPTPGGFLVGREKESTLLATTFTRVTSDGRRVVLIAGEPGIGKTALVAELARHAHAQGARVLYGRCDEELELPYQPLAEALVHYVAGAPPTELAAHVERHGGEVVRLAPDLARRLPDTPRPVVSDPEADRYRLFEAVVGMLAEASAAAPVVLVLDDLHWATHATLALVRHVVRSTVATPILVIGTYRHTEVGPALADALADLWREPSGVERLQLEGLDEEAVAAFMASARHGPLDDNGRAQAHAVHAHTSGNPFFVGELVRDLDETGATYRRQGPWSYYADSEGRGVPAGVQEVVARRLRRLPESANRLLVWGSVMGTEFDLDLVEALADHGLGADALDAAEGAVAGHILIELGPDRYRFAHALVRDAIYGGLTTTRRGRLHRAVGETLEAHGMDGDTRREALLAHHFAEAAAAGCAAKAADYALAAGRQAIAQAAWEEAAAFLERGVAALDAGGVADPLRRCDLLTLLAETWMRFFDPLQALPAAERALEAARQVGSKERLGAAAYWYVYATTDWRDRDKLGVVDAGARVGLETLAILGDDAPRWRACILVRAQSVGGADRETTARTALALARRSGDSYALGVALNFLAATLRGSPHPQEFLEIAEELVQSAPPDGWDGWRNGLSMRAMARLALGDRYGFESDVEACERFGSERRFWYFQWMSGMWRASLALLDGRFHDVEALALEAAALGRSRGLYQEILPRQRFRLHYECGDWAAALGAAEEAVEQFAENPIHRSMLHLAQAHVDLDRARPELQRFVDEGFGPIPPERVPVTLAYRAETAMVLGGTERAEHLYRELLPYQGQVVIGGMGDGCQGASDRFLGMLSTMAGRRNYAEGHFETALVLEQGLRSPPLLARTRCWYGRMLLDRGECDRARRLLAASLATAEDLGMAALAAEARTLID